MTKPQIKTFDFSKLKKYSRRHIETVNALLQAFPQLSAEEHVPSFIEVFEKDLGLKLDLRFAGIEEASFPAFLETLPSPCISAVLSLEPSEHTVILDLDFSLVRHLVDTLLGSETIEGVSALSPVEEGILDYLLLKAIQAIGSSPTLLGQNSIRILKVVREPKIMRDAFPAENAGCVLKFFLGMAERGGYIRIYLPHPLVEGVLLREDVIEGVLAPDEEDSLDVLLNRVSHIKSSVQTEVGRVTLLSSEKSQLEKGDVILFDETFASMGPHGIQGKAILRVEQNALGGWLAEVIDSENKIVLKVLDFFGD